MKKYLIYCVFALALSACSQGKRADYESTERIETDKVSNGLLGDTTIQKIIKTADMRFRVKDVQETKEKLSAAIRAEGGMLQEFTISSNIQNFEKVGYKTDSLMELTSYRKDGYVVAKIPSEQLDEFTNKVARMAVFVDNQSLKMEDVGLTYLSNKLKNENKSVASKQLDQHGEKQSKAVSSALKVKDDYVDNKIENLSIDSKVKYSTITLNFYQDNTVKKLIVANDSLYDQRPGFFTRLGLNIQNGWMIFKEFVLILANLWMLILVLAAGYFGFRYYRRQKKS